MIDLSQFNKKTFKNTYFVKKIPKPWGYEILFTDEHMPYAGKILHLTTGKRLSLQVHDKKIETQYLSHGRCYRIADNEQGEITKIEMIPGVGYTNVVGQRHRLEAITDCDIFEVSTPESGSTYRLEDDYQRPDETEDMRKEERKEL